MLTVFLALDTYVELYKGSVPILSCSMLAARADGHQIHTLEGLQEEASDFIGFIADQGADQCGFCNPGFVMNTIALLREIPDPTGYHIRAYLAGNLCRCSGYDGQLRGIPSRAPLGIPKSQIRVEKPRISSGFGAKQTAVCEVYPVFVTLRKSSWTSSPAMSRCWITWPWWTAAFPSTRPWPASRRRAASSRASA